LSAGQRRPTLEDAAVRFNNTFQHSRLYSWRAEARLLAVLSSGQTSTRPIKFVGSADQAADVIGIGKEQQL
jgi:hypothetical protein